jgi:hypothetical protein
MHNEPEASFPCSLARIFPSIIETSSSARTFADATATLSCSLILVGCVTMSVTQLPPQHADMFAARTEQEGLLLAARVIRKSDELQEMFNYDLPTNGILPVLVYFEDRSETSRFVIDKDKIGLYDNATAARDVELDLSNMLNGGMAVGTAGAGLISLPLVLVGLKVASDAEVIPHNMREKELRSTTLSPHGNAYGFLYYPTSGLSGDTMVLRAQIARPDREEPLYLNLRVSVDGD